MLTAAGLAALGACAAPARAPAPPPADGVVRLTFDGAPKGQPAVAPDGRSIAYVADRGGGWQLRILDLDTGIDRARTAVPGPVGGPAWSADGGTVHFYAPSGDSWRWFSVATGEPGTLVAPAPHPDGGLASAFRPRPEPGGGPRVLLDGVLEPGEDHDLFLWDRTAGELRRLAPDPGYDSDARWSPGGRAVAFHSDRGRDRYRLRVYRLDLGDGRVRAITPDDDAVYAYPSWSPSGRCIAHTVERDGDRDLRVVDADGGTAAVVAPRPGFDGEPVFTADGEFLVAVTDRWGGLELARMPLPAGLRDLCR